MTIRELLEKIWSECVVMWPDDGPTFDDETAEKLVRKFLRDRDKRRAKVRAKSKK